jgi:hypothetical protein
MEQATGIGPASSAWEADILPMNYACKAFLLYQKKRPYSTQKSIFLLTRKEPV